MERAGEQGEQRGLAGAVGADNAHPVPAQDTGGEILDDGAVAIGERDIIGDSHQLAGHIDLARHHARTAGGAGALTRLLAQCVQAREALDVALAPRGHAVAQPVLLHDQFAVELVAVALLLLQRVIAPLLEMGEAAIEPAGDAAIEPDDGAGERFQQAPVMADEHEGGAQGGQFLLQPGDGGEVEMVGGLVEQQDIGAGRQHAGEGCASGFAAGEIVGQFLAGQPQLFEQIMRPIRVIARADARFDIGEHIGEAGEVRLLWQIAHGGAGLDKDRAGVLLQQAGGDFEQG